MIPMVDIKWQHKEIWPELEPKIAKLYESCHFVGGPQIAEFEENFAEYTKSKYCLGVDSGTGALELIFHSMDRQGTELIMPVNTFHATAGAAVHVGLKPLFVDCNDSYLIDCDKVEELLRKKEADGTLNKVSGIVAVHLYGQMADMKRLREIAQQYGLYLIEDAAQAHGATQHQGEPIGKHSYAAAYSFFPGKNLGAYGDGGAITTNDEKLYQKLKKQAWFGCKAKYEHELLGTNSKLDTIQAIVLNEKLKHLESWNAMRRKASRKYVKVLYKEDRKKTVILPKRAKDNSHVYHLFVTQVSHRDKLIKSNPDIQFGIHYPVPLHMQESFKYLGYKPGDFPVARRMASKLVSFPIHPGISQESIDTVVERVKQHVIRAQIGFM